jgi:hypothetical protein
MRSFSRWSTRQKALLAAATVLMLFLPMGVTQQEQEVTTGHATFYNGQGFDPCLGAIAGILQTQVMWFNDQVLVTRYGGAGTYIYVTENGSTNPMSWTAIYTDGTAYDFVDPNGVSWHVDEGFAMNGEGTAVHNGNLPDPSDPPRAGVTQDRTYVWIVQLSAFPIHDQFAGQDPNNEHDLYNFLDIVDMCKFHRNQETHVGPPTPDQANDGGYNFNITHQNTPQNPNELSPAYGHPIGTQPHTHETFWADIWIGPKPVLVPIGVTGSDPVKWESDWSQGGASPTSQATGGAQGTLPNNGAASSTNAPSTPTGATNGTSAGSPP